MKSMRGAILCGAVMLATATGANAQSWIPDGVYVRGDVGGAFGNDVTFKSTNTAGLGLGSSTVPTTTGNSVLFGGGIGYRFAPMFRGDVTIDYMPSFGGKGTARGGVAAGTTAFSKDDSLVGLVNGYFDFAGLMPGTFGPFQPYIDGGIGFARNSLSRTTGTFVGGGSYSETGATRTNFAWGAGAGVAYALTPNLSIDVAYKYLDMGELRSGTSLTSGLVTGAVAANKSDDFTAHTVTLGLRWTFGGPPAPTPAPAVMAPPAPPPVAAAPQQQMFIVFFEFDKSALTADGKKVVDAAASAFKSGKSGIGISGYTDLSGTQQYNLALSKRRADIVKSSLVKDGVPASAINESWHGKENPRVPTADGVREPQNRRVEITM